MTCDLHFGVGFYYSTESGSKLQIPLDVDGFQIFVSLIIILYFILNFHYIGDDGIWGQKEGYYNLLDIILHMKYYIIFSLHR